MTTNDDTLTPERSITLKNEGDKPIVFGKAALNQAGTVYTASGLPVESSQLMPGATLELKVRANVKAPGAVTASIDIAVNDPLVNNSLKINLSVAGSQAMVSVDPKSINFGTGSQMLPIPLVPAAAGLTLTAQAAAFSLATQLGLVTSNGTAFTVGY